MCKRCQATTSIFCRELGDTLDAIVFAAGIREFFKPACAGISCGGRPGIDPTVNFEILIVGFFENFSANAPPQAVGPTLSLHAFLGYEFREAPPDLPLHRLAIRIPAPPLIHPADPSFSSGFWS